jgi:hypothetical protein
VTPEDYIETVRQRMQSSGAEVSTAQLPRGPALVGVRSQFRLRWMATKLHLLTVVVAAPEVDGAGLVEFANDALQYADDQKGAFRGFQVGVGAVPVIVAQHADDSAVQVARDKLIRNFAKFAWPTLVDLSTGTVHSHQGRVAIGGIYAGWIRQQIAATLPDPRAL